MTRHWVRLEPKVWRHTLRTRAMRGLRAWGLYLGALLIAAVVAWSMHYVSRQAQRGGNALIDAAMEQGILKELDDAGLTEEQREEAKKFLDQGK